MVVRVEGRNLLVNQLGQEEFPNADRKGCRSGRRWDLRVV